MTNIKFTDIEYDLVLNSVEYAFENLLNKIKDAKKAFYLSSERVQAMKDSGAWDDPERRARIIRMYMDNDRKNPPQSGLDTLIKPPAPFPPHMVDPVQPKVVPPVEPKVVPPVVVLPAKKQPKKIAPYGLKKDGTPKKKPGRKAA